MDTYESWEFEDELTEGRPIRYCLDKWTYINKRTRKERSRYGILRNYEPITQEEVPAELLERKVLILLEYFLVNGGKLIAREAIEEKLWGERKNSANLLDLNLGKLRRLLKDEIEERKNKEESGRLIITIRGAGLRFDGKNIRRKGPVPVSGSVNPAWGHLTRVPPLLHFIERPDLLAEIKSRLLDSKGEATIALHGMPGSGKTMLAIRAGRDPEIRRAFPDGIIWLYVGTQVITSYREHFQTVCRTLMGKQSGEAKEEDYRDLLEQKAALIVLDDVWNLAELSPFFLARGRSRLLFTSRDIALADSLRAIKVEVGKLNNEQARTFLGSWSGFEENLPEPHATSVLRECEGLTLALSMIGAALRDKPDDDWVDTVNDLRSAKLKNIRGHPDDYPYATLHAAIEVSVNALGDRKAFYLRLAVLPEAVSTPELFLSILWNVDEPEARRIAVFFANRSLLRREILGFTLHQLQLKYVHSEYPDAETLALLHAAIRRSDHSVRKRPGEVYAQLVGRLLPLGSNPAVKTFLKSLEHRRPRPGLNPLWAILDSAGDPSRRVFEGPATVCSIAASSDAERAVSLHGDGTVIAWDLTGKYPPRIRQKAATTGAMDGLLPISSTIAMTSDGRRALWGHFESLVIWDIDSDEEPRILTGKPPDPSDDREVWSHWIWAVALSTDGTVAVSLTETYLTIWDIESQGGEILRVMAAFDERPCTLVLEKSQSRFFFAGYVDGTIMIWDPFSLSPQGIVVIEAEKELEETNWLSTVAIEVDFNVAASSAHPFLPGYQPPELRSHERQVRIWDLQERDSQTIPAEPSPIGILAMAFAGTHLLVGGDAALILYDLENESQQILERPSHWITAVALTPDHKYGVTGDASGRIVTWDLTQNVREILGHSGAVTGVAFTADGQQVVSGGDDRSLILWDLAGNITEQRATPTSPLGPRRNPALEFIDKVDADIRASLGPREQMPESYRRVLDEVDDFHLKRLSGRDAEQEQYPIHALAVGDLADNASVRFLEGPPSPINAVALDADGATVVSCHGYWQDLRRRDPLGRMIHGGNIRGDSPLTIALSRGAKRVLGGYQNGALRFWDRNGEPNLLPGHEQSIWALAITPDGTRAISGGDDRLLLSWDLRGSPVSNPLPYPNDPVTAAAITRDGRFAASASGAGAVTIWDLDSGTIVRRLDLHHGPVFCLAFSPDAKRLVSGGADHILAGWDLSGRRPPATFTVDAEVRCCAATATHSAAGDSQGRVHLFVFDD
jgi:WD40 repeat protein